MAPDALRVLFLAPQMPYPPEQGAAMRNYNLLRHLGANHKVTLISFGGGAIPDEICRCCERVIAIGAPSRPRPRRLAELLHPSPDLALRLRSPAFHAAVRSVGRPDRFDVVQCEALELFRYAALEPIPLVLDEHNAEWRLQRRAYEAALCDRRLGPALYSLLQARKLARYEAAALSRAACALAVSIADAADLRRIAPAANLAVLPNGVDADLYAPMPEIPDDRETILFTGKMDFRPNVEGALWLAGEIMPVVWRHRPCARLVLFGQQPAPPIQRLCRDPRIVVTGHVPGVAAEKAALARASVVAVPLFSGGGTRLKVLNALAMARPVVSTPLGAAGYRLQSGGDLLLATAAPDFAAAVLRLLDDRALARALGAAGRRTVLRQYTWERLLPLLDRVYAGVAGG